MKNVILVDLDGVLIITPPWKPDVLHADGYSDFDAASLQNFNNLIRPIDAELWLTSSRRSNKTLNEFKDVFSNRKVVKELTGFIPFGTVSSDRLSEINAFLDHEPVKNFLIIDDDTSLHNLAPFRKTYWVNTNPLIGFNKEKLLEAENKIKQWI